MKILGLRYLQPGATPEQVHPILLAKRGIFHGLYTRQDHPGAMVVLEYYSV